MIDKTSGEELLVGVKVIPTSSIFPSPEKLNMASVALAVEKEEAPLGVFKVVQLDALSSLTLTAIEAPEVKGAIIT